MKILKRIKKDKKKEPDVRPFLDTYPSNSTFAEAYRTLRTNIDFSFLENKFKTLLVTSAGQGEGKTSTVFNIAYTMSQAGKKTLMIDADLRRPILSNTSKNHDSIGLTGILSKLFGTDVKEGYLNDLGLSDIIRLVSFQKKTGVLNLSDENDEIEIYFYKGELKDLNWLTRPKEKMLAASLIREGLLTSDKGKLALGRQKITGYKLGLTLINMGFLKEDDVKGHLIVHMMEGLRVAIQMTSGRYNFTDISELDLKKTHFDPIDLNDLYKEVLIGEEDCYYLQKRIDSAIVESDTPNLFLLGSGDLPPNPSELLGSKRMSFLISTLKKKFDVVVLDSPPVMPASDALLIAPQTDGVVFVIKAGHMNREAVNGSVEQLKMVKANLIGVILNNTDMQNNGYYNNYSKYYSGYYGDN
jgi:Mrp family chromosome partitioning ATPase